MKPEYIFDQWLVLKCQAGDAQAVKYLITRWQARIMRQVYYHIQNIEAARDVSQETWMAILRGIHKLKDPGRFGVWASRLRRGNPSTGSVRSRKKGLI